MSGGLLSTLDYIDYEQIERAVAGFEYLGMADAAAALRSALGLAFPDGPVAADEREEYTLGLPKAVLERVEGDLEQTLVDEDPAIEAAFRHAYRERPGDFEPV